jgi:hypothetical protein
VRKLMLVGRKHLGVSTLATRCAWCSTWNTLRDRVLAALGAKVSHTICPSCAAREFPEIVA